MAKNKFKGIEKVVKNLERIGVGVAPSMARAILESAAEKPLFEIKTGLTANGVPSTTYDFIRKNDSKFTSKRGVALLMGIDYSDPDAYKVNWMEYGTAPRYTKDGQFRGEITARKIIRPILDMRRLSMENEIEDAFSQEIYKLAKENGF